MLKQHLMLAVVGAALLATPALAQSANEPAKAPAAATSTDTKAMSTTGEWRSSKLIGVNVYNDNNEKIGDIADLLVDKDGKIVNVVLGVGGFLGVGEHDVAVAFDKLKFSDQPVPSSTASTTTTTRPATTGSSTTTTTTSSSASSSKKWYPDHAVFNATKDQLKAMPEFKF